MCLFHAVLHYQDFSHMDFLSGACQTLRVKVRRWDPCILRYNRMHMFPLTSLPVSLWLCHLLYPSCCVCLYCMCMYGIHDKWSLQKYHIWFCVPVYKCVYVLNPICEHYLSWCGTMQHLNSFSHFSLAAMCGTFKGALHLLFIYINQKYRIRQVVLVKKQYHDRKVLN